MSCDAERRLRLAAALVLSALLAGAGCAAAPVQEMSNARQAIQAAEQAGAEAYAPETLEEARALLSSAEAKLQRRSFKSAKEDAVSAHEKALEAMPPAPQSSEP